MKSLVLAIVVAIFILTAEAAFPHARWTRPSGIGADGEDVRAMMQKMQRVNRETIPSRFPDPMPTTHRSRSYHFEFGPRYPEHHKHLKNEHLYPEPHQLYY